MEGAVDIPATYLEQFAQAELAFIYQRVFCPRVKKAISLNELPRGGLSTEDEGWVGK